MESDPPFDSGLRDPLELVRACEASAIAWRPGSPRMRASVVRTAAPPSINNPAVKEKPIQRSCRDRRPLARDPEKDERPNFRDLGTVPPAALSPLTEQQGKLARQYDEEEEA